MTTRMTTSGQRVVNHWLEVVNVLLQLIKKRQNRVLLLKILKVVNVKVVKSSKWLINNFRLYMNFTEVKSICIYIVMNKLNMRCTQQHVRRRGQ